MENTLSYFMFQATQAERWATLRTEPGYREKALQMRDMWRRFHQQADQVFLQKLMAGAVGQPEHEVIGL